MKKLINILTYKIQPL